MKAEKSGCSGCLIVLVKKNSNVANKQFWQQHDKPIEIWSLNVFEQNLKYIHDNPAVPGFVRNQIDW
jgi:hypothetical protein